MNKQLTPLEAFDKALDIICKQRADNNLQSYIDIVETALKRYEDLERTHLFTLNEYKKQKKKFLIFKDKKRIIKVKYLTTQRNLKHLKLLKRKKCKSID